MKAEFPFPYQFEDYPSLDTRHEVARLIEQYQAQGHIKKCAHLHIAITSAGFNRLKPVYTPGCRMDSFAMKTQGLSHRTFGLFYGCPQDCRFYRPAWRGRVERWLKNGLWSSRQSIVGIAQWYASLSPFAQVIFALALLALLGAPWRETILEGLRIVFGK